MKSAIHENSGPILKIGRKVAFYSALIVLFALSACNNELTLQKYFVEKSTQEGYVALDISSSIINTDKKKLTVQQQTALKSFDKMNILAFKSDGKNTAEYDIESQKVAELLKGKEYQELMKVGSGKDAASVSFVGDEDHINEFVFFAKKKENGFAIVRVLGDDMNPNNIMNLISLLQSSDMDMEQLKPLQGLLK